MKIALIACPVCTLWAPHPDLLSLQARLRENSFETNLYDLNIDLFKDCNEHYKAWWRHENLHLWENESSFETFFLDHRGFFQNKALDIINLKYDLVIFSIGAGSLLSTQHIARILKSHIPGIPILAVDADCVLPESINTGSIDVVCVGECTSSVIDIATAIKKQGDLPVDTPELLIRGNAYIHQDNDTRELSDHGHKDAVTRRTQSKYCGYKNETILSFMDFMEGKSLPVRPLEVFIELSNVCNLKCAMCPTFSALSEHRHLSIKAEDRGFFELKESLESISEILKGTLNIHCFGYGESTIHPDFREIITFLSDYDVMLDFFTNGVNLDDSICSLLVENKVANITISFSGSTKEEYENIYLGGNFEQVLSGIKRLSDTKKLHNSSYPIIEVNSLAFEHHVSKLPEFIELMAEHGVNIIQLKSLQLHDTIPQLAGHKAVIRTWDKDMELIQRAREKASEYDIIFSATQFESNQAHSETEWKQMKSRSCTGKVQDNDKIIPVSDLKKIAKEIIPVKPEINHVPKKSKSTLMNLDQNMIEELVAVEKCTREMSAFPCMEPFKTMYIRKNNSVKPCCFSPDHALPMGNIKDNTLKEIWDGQGFSFLRNTILDDTISKQHCKDCLKNDFGPKYHNIAGLISQYLKWYMEKYGVSCIDISSDKFTSSGSNHDIITRHRNSTQDKNLISMQNPDPSQSDFKAQYEILLYLINFSLASDASTTHLLQYNFDSIGNQLVTAWIWSPKFKDCRLNIEIYLDNNKIAEVKADQFRGDLLYAGIGDGRYSILYELPNTIKDGSPHQITCKVAGTDLVIGTKTFNPANSDSGDPTNRLGCST